MIRKVALMTAATLVLAACGDSQQVEEDTLPPTDMQTGDVAVIPQLESVSRDAIDVDLDETLGVCTFAADGETLLVAGTTDGTRGVGVISLAGEEVELTGSEMGGPDAISVGPMMFAGDYTVEINRAETGGEAAMESTSYEATMALRKDGMSEVIYGPGTWECSV